MATSNAPAVAMAAMAMTDRGRGGRDAPFNTTMPR